MDEMDECEIGFWPIIILGCLLGAALSLYMFAICHHDKRGKGPEDILTKDQIIALTAAGYEIGKVDHD